MIPGILNVLTEWFSYYPHDRHRFDLHFMDEETEAQRVGMSYLAIVTLVVNGRARIQTQAVCLQCLSS